LLATAALWLALGPVTANADPATRAAERRGLDIYLASCSGCHGVTLKRYADLGAIGVDETTLRALVSRARVVQRNNHLGTATWQPAYMGARPGPQALPLTVTHGFFRRLQPRDLSALAMRTSGRDRIAAVLNAPHPWLKGLPGADLSAADREDLQAFVHWTSAWRFQGTRAVRLGGALSLALSLLLIAWWWRRLATADSGLMRWLGVADSARDSWPTVLLLGLCVAHLAVRTRPAAFDIVALLVVFTALRSGAILARARLAFAAMLAMLAAGGARSLVAVPDDVAPTVISHLLATVLLTATGLAAAAMVHRLRPDRDTLRRWLVVGVVGAFVATAAWAAISPRAIIYSYSNHPLGLIRLRGLFMDPNTWAGCHVIVWLVLLFGQRPRLRQLWPALLICPLAVVLSGSRAALGATAVAALLFAVRTGYRAFTKPPSTEAPRSADWSRWGAIALALVAIGAIIAGLIAGQLRPYDHDRVHGWLAALDLVSLRSLLVGAGTMAPEIAAGMTSPHLTLARLVIDDGLLVWGLYAFALHAVGVRWGWRHLRWMLLPLAAVLLFIDALHWRTLFLLPMCTWIWSASHSKPAPIGSPTPWWPWSWRSMCAAILAAAVVGGVAHERRDDGPRTWRLVVTPAATADTPLSVRRLAARDFADRLSAVDPPLFHQRLSYAFRKTAHGPNFLVDIPRPDPGDCAPLARFVCDLHQAAARGRCLQDVARSCLADATPWSDGEAWQIISQQERSPSSWPGWLQTLCLALAALAGVLAATGWWSLRRRHVASAEHV